MECFLSHPRTFSSLFSSCLLISFYRIFIIDFELCLLREAHKELRACLCCGVEDDIDPTTASIKAEGMFLYTVVPLMVLQKSIDSLPHSVA